MGGWGGGERTQRQISYAMSGTVRRRILHGVGRHEPNRIPFFARAHECLFHSSRRGKKDARSDSLT